MAGFVSTFITKEFTEIKEGGGKSPGMILDELIEKHLTDGKKVQSMEFNMEEDEWDNMMRAFHRNGDMSVAVSSNKKAVR